MTKGYQALREGAAWIDLSSRGKIRAAGEDRKRLLHAMTTNQVEPLEPGQGSYAFFLTAQGRILGDVNILCLEDALLLDTEPETCERLHQHLDKFIIADDVTLENSTARIVTIGVEGPGAEALLAGLGAPIPAADRSFTHWGDRIVARINVTGGPGFFLLVPAETRDEVVKELEGAGAVEATAEDVRTVRLENGKPRYGEDITQSNLPQETQQMQALNFQKGCYLGQEIVERVRSRGHVNRKLVQVLLDATEVPPPGTKVLTGEGKEAGELTSAAWSPAVSKVVALGYLRAEHLVSPSALTVAGIPVELTPPAK
ncbi:MAG: YgfZ/GcvT domain-containing protein [Bryobacteraceae bacterium]